MKKLKYARNDVTVDSKQRADKIALLLSEARAEYKAYFWASASKYIPMVLGSFLSFCGALIAFIESAEKQYADFTAIFVVASLLWLAWLCCLILNWIAKRPIQDVGRH
ncbi:hypothetical protein C9975_03070 [Thalassospira xiamenensis]|nr:hypothetical protein C9975_03070 [Thalassospira xiamenensis]